MCSVYFSIKAEGYKNWKAEGQRPRNQKSGGQRSRGQRDQVWSLNQEFLGHKARTWARG